MSKRSRSPKHVRVPRYPRWKSGKRERVGEHRRGEDHKLSVRKSAKQLRLALGDDKPKR